MKLVIKLVLIAILGMSSASILAAVSEKDAGIAIAAAEAERKKAASVDSEWRDTGKIIKKAQEAMNKGNYEKALKLANRAEHQGVYGYEQAMSQKDLKMPSYLIH